MYGRPTTDEALRFGTLEGARLLGTEHVVTNGVAGRPNQVIVHEVTGRHPHGWDILGRSARVIARGGRVFGTLEY